MRGRPFAWAEKKKRLFGEREKNAILASTLFPIALVAGRPRSLHLRLRELSGAPVCFSFLSDSASCALSFFFFFFLFFLPHCRKRC